MKKIIKKYRDYGLQIVKNKSSFYLSKNINFDENWHFRQDYLYHIDRFNYIHLTSLSENLTPIFITLTLPSKYHAYVKRGDKHYANPKFEGLTISQGYNKLQEIFRTLYNKHSVRVNGKVIVKKYKFVRVVEPHKDFTPHLHAVIYVDDVESFKKHFYNVIFRNSLEQVDFEILQKESHSLAYLLKYVSKTIDSNNMMILGWKSLHKIVQVRTSKMPFNKSEYKLFKSQVSYDDFYRNFFFQMKHQLACYRHTVTVYDNEERQFFTKESALNHYFDDMDMEEVRYTSFSDIKYVLHSYHIKKICYDYFSFDVEAKTEQIISSVPILDDVFDFPIYLEEDNGLFVPLVDEYLIESIEDDLYNDILFHDDTRSLKTLSIDFNSVC